jgi:solute carrier family 25 phosphate transporter 3
MRRRTIPVIILLTFLLALQSSAFSRPSHSIHSSTIFYYPLKLHQCLQRAKRIASSLSHDDRQKGEYHLHLEDVKWNNILVPKNSQHDDPSLIDLKIINPVEKRKIALFAILALSMMIQLYRVSEAGSWRYYLAGGLCAAASHTIPVPIDVVKTRKQVDPKFQDMSFVEATKAIVRVEGVGGLLAGLGPTTFGYMFEGAIKFGVYEVLKPILRDHLLVISQAATWLSCLNSQLFAFAVSGAASGFAAAMVLCPMESLRIRMVAESDFAPHGFLQGIGRMFKLEGVSFMWKGLIAMCWKQVPYTITKNVSFDYFARHGYASLIAAGMSLTPTVKLLVPFAAAALTSILSCISSQPGDMLLSLVNAHGGTRRTRDVFSEILKSDRGAAGLFVGINARFVHVGVIVTLQLLIYDLIKRICGIAATGLP